MASTESTYLLDPDGAAKKLNVSTRFLQLDRVTKRRIPFVKVGRFVRYRMDDLDTYIERSIIGGEAS